MTADELIRAFSMQAHPENGTFMERHYENAAPGRAASGSIYYYVAAGEQTKFHRIDCDEYWCYNAGSPLEVWMLSPEGEVSTVTLGIEKGCEPLVYIKSGVLFASRSCPNSRDGTFVTCITVPRFDYRGFELMEDDEVWRTYPQLADFFG